MKRTSRRAKTPQHTPSWMKPTNNNRKYSSFPWERIHISKGIPTVKWRKLRRWNPMRGFPPCRWMFFLFLMRVEIRSRLIEGIAPLGYSERKETKLKEIFSPCLGGFLQNFSTKTISGSFPKNFQKNLTEIFSKNFKFFSPKSLHKSASNTPPLTAHGRPPCNLWITHGLDVKIPLKNCPKFCV